MSNPANRKLHSISAIFTQESSSKLGEWEELRVEMIFNPGGQIPYFVFRSKQWAIDSPEEITHILESLKKVANDHETML